MKGSNGNITIKYNPIIKPRNNILDGLRRANSYNPIDAYSKKSSVMGLYEKVQLYPEGVVTESWYNLLSIFELYD